MKARDAIAVLAAIAAMRSPFARSHGGQ